MHVVANEQALAHWEALNGLPLATLNSLRTRFLSAQPYLAFMALPKEVAKSGPDAALSALEDLDNPAMSDFWRIATSAAMVSEILCREAGRPLRQLNADEVRALFTENLDLLERLDPIESKDGKSAPNLLNSCRQPHLLKGVLAAHVANHRIKNPALPWEILMLRVMIDGLHLACGDEPASETRSWDAERIQYALASQGDPLRREALAACDRFREELAPQLIEELAWWSNEPAAALEEDGSLGHHALYLLARWRESSAWPVVRRLVALPDAGRYELLGDFITEDASVVLAMIVGGQSDELRAMVEDDALDEYTRVAALDALTCLVVWGELPRDGQIAYLGELLSTRLNDPLGNELVLGAAVCAVCDLEAWELRSTVEAAFARGVVDEDYIDLDCFARLAHGRLPGRQEAFRQRHQPITNVAEATTWLDARPEVQPPPAMASEERVLSDSTQPYSAPPKVGRNDPCPCGSGKKYKKCCLK